MSHRVFARFRLISISLFVFGLVSVAVAFSINQSSGNKLRHRKGFTLIRRETAQPFNGPPDGARVIVYSISTRYQKSDGTWKQIQTYYNSKDQVVKKDIGVGIPGQGVFKADLSNRVLEFLSSMPSVEKSSYVSIYDARSDPHFLKNDSVHGFETYVLHFPEEDGGYIDLYCAPELDNTPIREVSVSPKGIGITEVVDVKFGDPDDRVFNGLPKWLIHYDRFKQKIATMEENGNHLAAEALRKEMEEQIAKQAQDQ